MTIKKDITTIKTTTYKHKAVIELKDILEAANLNGGKIFYRCAGSPASHSVDMPIASFGRIEIEWEETVKDG